VGLPLSTDNIFQRRTWDLEASHQDLAKRKDHALVKILDKPPQAAQLRKTFLLPEQPAITSAVARLAQAFDFSKGVDRFVLDAVQELPDFRATLQNVQRCERYLASIETIFEWLCGADDNRISVLTGKLDYPASQMSRVHAGFLDSGLYKGLAGSRASALAALEVGDKSKLLVSLITHHEATTGVRFFRILPRAEKPEYASPCVAGRVAALRPAGSAQR
jgi:hypothetical protein